MVGRTDFVQQAAQLNEFIVSHAPTMIQRGGEAAIVHGEDDIAAMVEEFQERRDFSAEMLLGVPGVNLPEPEGAFYLFPQLDGIEDSFQFAMELLRETSCGRCPGQCFRQRRRRFDPHLLRAWNGCIETGNGTNLRIHTDL